jgi:hypothetical protein
MEKHLTVCKLNCAAITGAKVHFRVQAETEGPVGGQGTRHCQCEATLSVVLGQFPTGNSYAAIHLQRE